MLKSWRWFGPKDPIGLEAVRQTSATGIVSALHHWPNGETWPLEEILDYKEKIEATQGLKWEVIESIPVVESIKQGKPDRDEWIDKYRNSLKNVGKAGIKVVCYNFMPVLDWTRTHLQWPLPTGGYGLYYLKKALIAFDIFLLKRKGAESDYPEAEILAAEKWLHSQGDSEINQLIQTLIAGLPGSELGFDIESFRKEIEPYKDITLDDYRSNLSYFLNAILPTAEEAGLSMAIHPDDPPFSILGLPRIISTQEDLTHLFSHHPSPSNALTFCTGSLGARPDNDIQPMWDQFASRVAFLHLRNVSLNEDGDFWEDDHLAGRANMSLLIQAILKEEERRGQEIPMRPDHGHHLLDDLMRSTNPGYSLIGRLKGLAQLEGVEEAIKALNTSKGF
ncbi:MAG: mannonate dehydratase [Bacteroidia bacterium]|nr:mannonate dehydratase [Bacteroidia bacterium]